MNNSITIFFESNYSTAKELNNFVKKLLDENKSVIKFLNENKSLRFNYVDLEINLY